MVKTALDLLITNIHMFVPSRGSEFRLYVSCTRVALTNEISSKVHVVVEGAIQGWDCPNVSKTYAWLPFYKHYAIIWHYNKIFKLDRRYMAEILPRQCLLSNNHSINQLNLLWVVAPPFFDHIWFGPLDDGWRPSSYVVDVVENFKIRTAESKYFGLNVN